MNELGLSSDELATLRGYPPEVAAYFLKIKQTQAKLLPPKTDWDEALNNLKHISQSEVAVNEIISSEIQIKSYSEPKLLLIDQIALLSTSKEREILNRSATDEETSDEISDKNLSTEDMYDLCLADDLLSIKTTINSEELNYIASQSSSLDIPNFLQKSFETINTEFTSAASSIYIPDGSSIYYDQASTFNTACQSLYNAPRGEDDVLFRTACQSLYREDGDILYRTASQSLYSVAREETSNYKEDNNSILYRTASQSLYREDGDILYRTARQSIYDVPKEEEDDGSIFCRSARQSIYDIPKEESIQSISMTRCPAEVINSDVTSLISSSEDDDELERFPTFNLVATLPNTIELHSSLDSIIEDGESSDDEQQFLGSRFTYNELIPEEDLPGLKSITEEPTLESLLKDTSSLLEVSFEFNHSLKSQLLDNSPQLIRSNLDSCPDTDCPVSEINHTDFLISSSEDKSRPHAGLSPMNEYATSPSINQPSPSSGEPTPSVPETVPETVPEPSPLDQPMIVNNVTPHRKKPSPSKLESNSTGHDSPNSKLSYQNNPKPYQYLRRTYSERALKHSPIMEEVDDDLPEHYVPYPIKNELSAPSTAMVSMTTSLDAALEGLNQIKPRRSHSLLHATFQKKMKQFNLLPQSFSNKPPLLQRLKHLVSGRTSPLMPRLFQFDPKHSSCLIAMGSPISATCLSTRHTYVLECEDVIYIWFGNQATEGQQREASWFAGNLLNNHADVPIRPTIKMEFEGSEQLEFMTLFSDWHLAEELQSYLKELSTRKIPGQEILNEAYHHPPSETLLQDTFFISLKVWVMKKDQNHLEIPVTEHGIFYSQESYVMLYHYQDTNRDHHHIIFYWIGRDSPRAKEPILPPSKVHLDGHNKATVVQILQGREPASFMNLFHISFIVKWGHRLNSHFQHGINDRSMYSIRGQRNQMVSGEQTTIATKYLCSGRSFIIIYKSDIFVWHGIGSYLFERKAAVKIAYRLATSFHSILEVQEKLEPKRFWQALGNDRQGYADNLGWARKPFLLNQYQPRLFQITTQPTIHISEITPFHQRDLKSNGIYLLDAYFDCYIWGPFDEKLPPSPLVTSIYLALEYTRLVNTYHPRPFQLVPSVVLSHYEPPEFIAAFPSWSPISSQVMKRPSILRQFNSVIPVTHLLSQWRTSPTLTPQRHSPRAPLPIY